jgi:tripartite motif-containing protein 71
MPRLLIIIAALISVLPTIASAQSQPQIPVAQSDQSFAHPHDLALSPDAKHLYVADLDNNRIAVLDAATLALVSIIGKGELSGPHDVTFDTDGQLWVADTGNNRIAVYTIVADTAGKPLGKLSASWDKGVTGPEGVAIAGKGQIFVSNTNWGSVIMMRRGRAVGGIENPAPGMRNFKRPHDVMMTRDGRLLVADSGNHRVVVFNSNLKLAKILVGPPYDFNEPKYLAEGDDGLIYIADEKNNRIVVLDKALSPIGAIGSGAKGDAPGQLNWPEGVVVKGKDIWVADTYNNRILRFRRE